MSDDISDELYGINLGDKRLNDRSVLVIKALAAQPQASINAACSGWDETLAAYRLCDNKKVTPEKILAPHRQATVQRMRQHPVILIAQDTTELDQTAHPPKDALCLNSPKRFGIYHHVELAITPDMLPLGVVGTKNFARTPESLGKSDERANLPIEQKESGRWLAGYQNACKLAKECPDTRIVSVADREADIYDILLDAQKRLPLEEQPPTPVKKRCQKQSTAKPKPTEPSTRQTKSLAPSERQDHTAPSTACSDAPSGCNSSDTAPQPRADYIIRAKLPRCTTTPDPDAGEAAYRQVRAEVKASPLLGVTQVELPTTAKRAARLATLEVRALTVLVKPPHARSHLAPVKTNFVLVEEVGGPDDDTRVSWLLITTLPVSTVEEALQVVAYYAARWAIEIYFRTLKSGCKVEEIRLETTARFQNALAFYDIIAWRVVYLTYLNRECPELPCTAVFSDAEWKSTWRVVKRQPLPPTAPNLGEFMKLVAELGGHNNRATDFAPGAQSIWMGLRRTIEYATAWLAFGPTN